MASLDVIIPSRGHANFLGEAISSVLDARHTGTHLRVIVVADGCPDSARVAEWFSRNHNVTVIEIEDSVGCYRAINTGLSKSEADWVTFCGADDRFTPDRIERLFQAADPLGWRAVCNTWHRKMTATGTAAKLGSEALGGVFMYSAQMMDLLGGFKDWPCSADTDLYNRAILAGGIRAVIKKPCYLYRQHDQQLTKAAATAFGTPLRLAYQTAADNNQDIYAEPWCGRVKGLSSEQKRENQ